MLKLINKNLKMSLEKIKKKSKSRSKTWTCYPKRYFVQVLLQGKKLWKFFIFLFLVSFIVINWSDISWVFNYKVIYRGLSNFFERNKIEAVYFDKEDSIEIPKIEVKAPIIFPENNSEGDFEKALKKGVLHYPQSVLPGEEGTTILLGHSAPPNWPKIDYDWIFNDLNKLNTGDEIYIYFNQSRYIYEVTEEFFLNPGQDIPQPLTNSKHVLNLISCWPPGRDQERIAIRAELVN